MLLLLPYVHGLTGSWFSCKPCPLCCSPSFTVPGLSHHFSHCALPVLIHLCMRVCVSAGAQWPPGCPGCEAAAGAVAGTQTPGARAQGEDSGFRVHNPPRLAYGAFGCVFWASGAVGALQSAINALKSAALTHLLTLRADSHQLLTPPRIHRCS